MTLDARRKSSAAPVVTVSVRGVGRGRRRLLSPADANSAMLDADDARRPWELSEQLTA